LKIFSFTSIYAGIVLFSYLGSIAHERGVEISDVATKGAGLAFILYPDAVARFPFGQIWSIVFFLMLLLLGFGTQFSTMESILTTAFDFKPERRKFKTLIVAVVCFLMFCCGLVFCTNVRFYQIFLNII
jgi:SNF family Na+-dependent transporter